MSVEPMKMNILGMNKEKPTAFKSGEVVKILDYSNLPRESYSPGVVEKVSGKTIKVKQFYAHTSYPKESHELTGKTYSFEYDDERDGWFDGATDKLETWPTNPYGHGMIEEKKPMAVEKPKAVEKPMAVEKKNDEGGKEIILKFSVEAGAISGAEGLEGFVDPLVSKYKKEIGNMKTIATKIARETLKKLFPTASRIDALVLSAFVSPIQTDGGIRIYQKGKTVKGELIYDEVKNADRAKVEKIVKGLIG